MWPNFLKAESVVKNGHDPLVNITVMERNLKTKMVKMVAVYTESGTAWSGNCKSHLPCHWPSSTKKFAKAYRHRVLSDPKHIAAVFKDSHNHHKAVSSNSGQLMYHLLGHCVGLVSGSRWRALRGVTETAFSRTAVRQYTSCVGELTAKYLDGLEYDGKRQSESGRIGGQSRVPEGLLHPVSDLKFLPFLIIARIIYDPLPATLLDQLFDLAPIRETVFRDVIAGGISRFWISKYVPLASNKLLREYKLRWAAFNDSARSYAAVRMTERTSDEIGMSKTENVPVLEMFKSVDSGELSREELLQTLDEILWANLDVTMGGLSWTLVFLAANQSAQSKLRAEIFSVKSQPSSKNDSSSSNHNKTQAIPSLTDYLASTSSSYLNSCILEAARLRPIAAFSVPQSAPTSRLLSSYRIPAGTNFIIDSYALNVHNTVWGSNGKEYLPERWQQLEQKTIASSQGTRYNYWRFGFGPRQCMGKYVADLILRKSVIEVLGRWRLELEEHQRKAEQWEGDGQTWIHLPDMQLRCVKLDDPYR